MMTQILQAVLTSIIAIGAFVLLRASAFKKKAVFVKFSFLDSRAKMPSRGTEEAAGMDLFLNDLVVLEPGVPYLIPTGVSASIPAGYFGMVRGRSSALKKGISIQGTIDSDYRGEIFVIATNISNSAIVVEAGKAIAQMILVPYFAPPSIGVSVTQMSKTERQAGGFGSTGASI